MRKAAYMAVIFTFGLWTGGIFAPNQTPAVDHRPQVQDVAVQTVPQAPTPQETPERGQR
ncbi:MAG: hypothetical protein IT445_03755 [Phycisphaeraceae bacterium]|nr:hypothetical protein [Phycisphaeraceae bacterium]